MSESTNITDVDVYLNCVSCSRTLIFSCDIEMSIQTLLALWPSGIPRIERQFSSRLGLEDI